MLRHVNIERLPGYFFHNGAAHHESRVDVFVGRTRLKMNEIQLRQERHGQCLVARELQFARNTATGIRHTRRVGEQMLDPDVLPEGCLELRKVFGHRVFQRQFPFLGQLQDGNGCELLRHRGDVEERVAVDGHFRVEVSDAVALVKDDVVALQDQDGCARLVSWKQGGA